MKVQIVVAAAAPAAKKLTPGNIKRGNKFTYNGKLYKFVSVLPGGYRVTDVARDKDIKMSLKEFYKALKVPAPMEVKLKAGAKFKYKDSTYKFICEVPGGYLCENEKGKRVKVGLKQMPDSTKKPMW